MRGNRMAPSVSFCCLSGGPPARTAALVALVRPAVDEVVIALDERLDPAALGHLPELCDELVRYPYAEPVERAFAWLHGLCGSDWVLRLDDDEVPSLALLKRLQEVVAEPELTHAHVPRRWLHPDGYTWLTDAPWTPGLPSSGSSVTTRPSSSVPGHDPRADRRRRAGGVARRADLPPRPGGERPGRTRGEGTPLRARSAGAAGGGAGVERGVLPPGEPTGCAP